MNENQETPTNDDEFESIQRLNKDLKEASKKLTQETARYFTDRYYQIQKNRIAASFRVKACEGDAEFEAGRAGR